MRTAFSRTGIGLRWPEWLMPGGSNRWRLTALSYVDGWSAAKYRIYSGMVDGLLLTCGLKTCVYFDTRMGYNSTTCGFRAMAARSSEMKWANRSVDPVLNWLMRLKIKRTCLQRTSRQPTGGAFWNDCRSGCWCLSLQDACQQRYSRTYVDAVSRLLGWGVVPNGMETASKCVHWSMHRQAWVKAWMGLIEYNSQFALFGTPDWQVMADFTGTNGTRSVAWSAVLSVQTPPRRCLRCISCSCCWWMVRFRSIQHFRHATHGEAAARAVAIGSFVRLTGYAYLLWQKLSVSFPVLRFRAPIIIYFLIVHF
jgi:hypothetical protein